MESIFDVRRMDDLGRVVVPASIRKKLNWGSDTALEIMADEKGVFLRRYKASCVFCGAESDLMMFGNKCVCKKYIGMIKA